MGYVAGKPIGIVAASWLATRLSGGRVRPPVGWAALAAGGSIAGIGFTVSLLIADHAFRGEQLAAAKLGVFSAGLCASTLTWLVFPATTLLPGRLRTRALVGTAETILDLAVPVDERDHGRGPEDAPVTLVEYDFECPYCGQAEPVVRELLRDFGDVRYVWRNLPLSDVHPHAELAAEAAEADAAQDAFWQMHDLLLEHQDALTPDDLIGYAEELGLDIERFTEDLESHAGTARVADDVDGADLTSVTGTPTFSSTAGATTARTTSKPPPKRCAARARAAVALVRLLVDRSLGGRDGFESFVRDRLPAFDREAVGAVGQARLGSLDGSELVAQIVRQPLIELVLVEIGGKIRQILLVRRLAGVLMP